MEGDGYWLGVDLGTCTTTAATRDSTSTTMVSLGRDGHDMPSVVAITDDGVLVGEAAHRRARIEPGTVAREFKRRMGDTTPMLVGGRSVTPEWLTAQVLGHVIASAREQRGTDPDGVTLTYPATWGDYRLDRMREVAAFAGLDSVELLPEPEAAARFAASTGRLDVGQLAAVFDLGGGTFDTALVRRTDPSSYEVEGRAIGLERLGGVDLDQALFDHVVDTLDLDLAELPDTPTTLAAVVQLRDDVIGAKEQLSFDSSTVVPVMLEGRQTQVRLTRSEFETLARPFIDRAVDSLEEAIDTAGIARGQVDVIVPVGGTSRVPLVAERLSSRLGIPIASATNPRHAVALGAVVASSPPEPSSADLDEESPSLVDDRSLVVAAAATSADAPTAAELPPPAAEPPSLPPAGDSAAVVEPVDVVAGGGPTRSSRLLLVGALAVLVLAVVGVWQLIGDRDAGGDDVSATGGVEASDDGETDQREATGEVPSTGFEIENPVGNGYQSSAFGLPLADSGPSRLPQQLWQNQVPGMFQTPVGSGGVLVASGAEQVGDRYLSRLTAIDPSTGAEVWRHETIDFLHAYFVGDGAVVGLFQVDPLVHDAEAIEPLRLDAVLIDLTTGNPQSRLDITSSSVDVGMTPLMSAVLQDNVVVTSWHDGTELISSAYDLAAAQPLWEQRDPAPEFAPSTASDHGVFVVYGDGLLVVRDLRSGERLWSTVDVTGQAVKAVAGGVIVIGGATGRTDFDAFDLQSGEARWSVAQGLTLGFTVDEEYLYGLLSDSDALYAVDLTDGSLRWEERLPNLGWGLDLIRAGDDRVYLIDEGSNLVAFDARNGEPLWQSNVGTIGAEDDYSFQLTTAGEVVFVHLRDSIVAFG